MDGIFLPLMGGPLLSAPPQRGLLGRGKFHRSRADAVVAVVRVVVVERPVRIHVADVVRVRRVRGAHYAQQKSMPYKEYPNETPSAFRAEPRCILFPPRSCEVLDVEYLLRPVLAAADVDVAPFEGYVE